MVFIVRLTLLAFSTFFHTRVVRNMLSEFQKINKISFLLISPFLRGSFSCYLQKENDPSFPFNNKGVLAFLLGSGVLLVSDFTGGDIARRMVYICNCLLIRFVDIHRTQIDR